MRTPDEGGAVRDHKGLYRKFDVRRTDGTDAPGQKHEHCVYFVLDVTHDDYAKAALLAYAEACKAERPALAQDVLDLVREGGLLKTAAEMRATGDLAPRYVTHIPPIKRTRRVGEDG